jgi:hypothetical protein
MTVEALEQIERASEESLQYRRRYAAEALVTSPSTPATRIPVHFVIEQDALGRSTVSVYLDGEIDYPRVPVIRALKEYIQTMDAERKLP